MHHPTGRIAHTTAFVTPVVEHWLERELEQSKNVPTQIKHFNHIKYCLRNIVDCYQPTAQYIQRARVLSGLHHSVVTYYDRF